MAAEGDVELAPAVEAAEAVVTGAIEVVEELRRLAGLGFAEGDELVEARAMAVIRLGVVLHLDVDGEAAGEPAVEVDVVGVEVVEQGLAGPQPERDGEPAGQRLDEAAMAVLAPVLAQLRQEPALAAGPLEGRSQRFRLGGRRRGQGQRRHELP